MFHRIYFHVVWTTRDRAPLIDARVATFLTRYFRSVAHQERCQVLEIGMVRTHVHVLIRAHPMTEIARLLQRWKGGSAAVGNKERHTSPETPLHWAKGYSIQSVSSRHLPAVRRYLQQQPRRHPKDVIPGWDGDRVEIVTDRG